MENHYLQELTDCRFFQDYIRCPASLYIAEETEDDDNG
jgi:hypothetical protein